MGNPKVIFGVVVSLAMVVTLTIVYILTRSPVCELVRDEPEVSSADVKPIASSDYKYLARFAANLQHKLTSSEDSDDTFLSLDFVSIDYIKNESGLLVISTRCANLYFTMNPPDFSGVTTVSTIAVELAQPSGQWKECVVREIDISFDNEHHYKCENKVSYVCYNTDPLRADEMLASLNINVLEFELVGFADPHMKGSFVTPSKLCSNAR